MSIALKYNFEADSEADRGHMRLFEVIWGYFVM